MNKRSLHQAGILGLVTLGTVLCGTAAFAQASAAPDAGPATEAATATGNDAEAAPASPSAAPSAQNAAPLAQAMQAARGQAEPGSAPSATALGRMAPTPDLVPGIAGASRVPLTGSVPNAATADYPTDATADYVFACMASNGDTRTALEQCSCSFDVVATLLPYERYIEASTFLSMGQVAGEKGSLFRSSEEAKATVADLRRAQAEAEVRCFD